MNSFNFASTQTARGTSPNGRLPVVADASKTCAFDKDQLVAIREQLQESHGTWPEEIAASVEEDYRQLLKDFGLR